MRDALEVLDLVLRLPVGGKTYRVDPPTAAVGIRLQGMLAAALVADAITDRGEDAAELRAELTLSGDREADFGRDCLGPAYDEMLADDVPAPVVELAITTAFYAWTVGRDFARAWWDAGGKAPAPMSPRRPTETRTRPAAANTTPSRASRTGMRAARKRRRAMATRSRRSGRTAT